MSCQRSLGRCMAGRRGVMNPGGAVSCSCIASSVCCVRCDGWPVCCVVISCSSSIILMPGRDTAHCCHPPRDTDSREKALRSWRSPGQTHIAAAPPAAGYVPDPAHRAMPPAPASPLLVWATPAATASSPYSSTPVALLSHPRYDQDAACAYAPQAHSAARGRSAAHDVSLRPHCPPSQMPPAYRPSRSPLSHPHLHPPCPPDMVPRSMSPAASQAPSSPAPAPGVQPLLPMAPSIPVCVPLPPVETSAGPSSPAQIRCQGNIPRLLPGGAIPCAARVYPRPLIPARAVPPLPSWSGSAGTTMLSAAECSSTAQSQSGMGSVPGRDSPHVAYTAPQAVTSSPAD